MEALDILVTINSNYFLRAALQYICKQSATSELHVSLCPD